MKDVKILSQSEKPGSYRELESLRAIGGTLWTQVDPVELTRWTITASLLNERVVIPAGLLKKGAVIRFKLRGIYRTLSSTVYSAGIILNTTTVSRILGFSPSKSNAVTSYKGWNAEGIIFCKTNEKISSHLDLNFNVGSSNFVSNQFMSFDTDEFSFDFSQDITFDFRLATSASSASNVFTNLCSTLEVLI